MKARCVKACNLCKPKPYQDHATLAACKDKDHSCGQWSRDEECEKNPEFMLTTCHASCRQCQSLTCNDVHPECVQWAEAGECQTNADFMLDHCRFSCNICHVNFKKECRRDKARSAWVEVQ